MVLLTAWVQCEYDFVRVVCSYASVYVILTEVLWMAAGMRCLVCLYSFQLCLECESGSMEWLCRSFSIGRWDSKSLYVGQCLSFRSHMIRRLFWSMYVSVCWSGKWELVCDWNETSLTPWHEKQCPCISNFPMWWWWAAFLITWTWLLASRARYVLNC